MPALIERPKMTRTMYQSLKRHIMKERDKIKQAEQDQEAAQERVRKEREMRKKKEQEDSLTLEQTKEQVSELEKRLESLRKEKHELFSSLKKVLHHEDETKRRTQMKEHNELLQLGQHYPPQIPVSSHPIFLRGTSHPGRPSMYKPPQSHHIMQGIKRPRSPSPQPHHPPPVSVYGQHFQDGSKYTQAASYTQSKIQQGPYGQQKHGQAFQPQTTRVYSSQPGHSTYQQPPASYTSSQQTSGGKYPATQSAFSSYPTHFAHQQKQISEQHYSTGYPIQRIQQGYITSQHSSAMQQQLEHGQKTASYAEEKYKMAAMRSITGVPPQQAAMLPQVQLQQQQAQNKGSIVAGYPVRTQQQQPTSHANTFVSSQAAYSSQQNSSPHQAQRHGYLGSQQQQQGRYY